MKRRNAFIISVMMATMCLAQEMTLSECITTGIENNLSLANARINIEKGRTGVSQNRARLLPLISGSFQFTDYLISPVNVTTGTLLGNDFADNPTWQTIKSMQYNVSTGVQLSLPIYDQTIFAAIDVARTVENISKVSYEKAVEDLTMQMGKIYYMAQASQKLQQLTDENIERMEALCEITEALYQQGVVLEVDLNRVHINLQTLKAQRLKYYTQLQQQLNLLRYLMDMSVDEPLCVTEISDGVEHLVIGGVSDALPELLLPTQQKQLAEQRIKAVKAGYLPSISFFGYVGGLAYQDKFHHFFNTDAAKDNWFGNSYIGLSVKIPIFDANSKKHQIKQYKYDALQADNTLELTRKLFDQRYADASLQLNYNIELYDTQNENRRQAENVFNVTEEQYKEGIASMSDLLQDEMRLRTAQAACIQAICQCNLARLDLLKLSGNLPQLTK